MRIAVFGDIHSNKHALEAVLADIDQEAPDKVFCLGDLVGYGAYPNEVIEIIRNRSIPTIMGNYDDGVGFDRDECGCAYKDLEARRLGGLSLTWTKARVTAENKAFLRSLAPSIRLVVGNRRVLLVHGSPRRINEYVYEDRPQWSLERIAQSAQADVLIFGHTHLPYVRRVGSVLFINPGSAGKPKDGNPRAAYALVDVGQEVKVELRRVACDVAAAAEAVRSSGLPLHFADLLERASG